MHGFEICKRILLHNADIRFLNVFGRKIRWKTALRSGILFAKSEVIHRPRSSAFRYYDLMCKRDSVGQSEELLIPRSSVRIRLKPENLNLHGFELHKPSIKIIKLLLKVIRAILIIIRNV